MILLHLSDLHCGPPYMPQVAESLIRMATRFDPDAIVISGDFTQRAKPEQFADAAEFLTRLPECPKMVVPGNHDVPLYRVRERWADPLGLYKQYISPDLDSVLRLEDAVLVGLDSTAPHSAISNGRLKPSQLDFCAQAFADVPADIARIVVAHHHFAPAPDFERDQTMPKAKRAINRFVDLGVELVLGGHLHRAYIGNPLDFYPGNHRDHGIVIVQCGTSTSRRGRGREREKNSFNEISITREMLEITHYVYFHDCDTFLPLSRHQFPRIGRHFVDVKQGHGIQAMGDQTECG